MTVEEAIKQLREQVVPNGSPASVDAIAMAVAALETLEEKEKEPQPEQADKDSSKNNSIKDDNTKLKICQEIIGQNIEQLVIHHTQLSDAEKRLYVDLCFVEQVLKEVTQCQ